MGKKSRFCFWSAASPAFFFRLCFLLFRLKTFPLRFHSTETRSEAITVWQLSQDMEDVGHNPFSQKNLKPSMRVRPARSKRKAPIRTDEGFRI
ncbi:MAG: hypothetical protein D6714_15850 [Bacteroidetes bacterium]|nr:MAG: hypothetical protein D6714_15850 [Bacteroidota bacterium]